MDDLYLYNIILETRNHFILCFFNFVNYLYAFMLYGRIIHHRRMSHGTWSIRQRVVSP